MMTPNLVDVDISILFYSIYDSIDELINISFWSRHGEKKQLIVPIGLIFRSGNSPIRPGQ